LVGRPGYAVDVGPQVDIGFDLLVGDIPDNQFAPDHRHQPSAFGIES
jgi:hypothetical protein